MFDAEISIKSNWLYLQAKLYCQNHFFRARHLRRHQKRIKTKKKEKQLCFSTQNTQHARLLRIKKI